MDGKCGTLIGNLFGGLSGRCSAPSSNDTSPNPNLLRLANEFPSRAVCELLSEGVAAIFGPGTSETSGIVSSIADAVEVPHITAFWQREPMGGRTKHNDMTINIHPDPDALSRAYAELLIDYTWKSYTIVYEDDDGLVRLKDVLQIHDPQSSPITVRYEGMLPNQLISTGLRRANFAHE